MDAVAIGQDFGFNHANAILLIGNKDGNLYILRELYVYEKDTEEIIDMAKGRFPLKTPMWCDSAEPDRIQMWRKAGYNARPVSKETTRGAKYQKTQVDWLKQRTIYIDPSCTNTLKEIGQWKWKKDAASGQYLDEPVDFFDDAMAALRYGVEGWRKGDRGRIQTFKHSF